MQKDRSSGLEKETEAISFEEFRQQVLKDYRLACESREASLLGRKEVLTGKAKFGIFGDGKEVAQIAMAKCFRKGDFRSGYYRDQTFMFAIGNATYEQFFAQLYAHPDLKADPFSAGRQMNAHFATRSLDEHGNWRKLTEIKNSAADLSPTSSQMPRAVGLALASKIYRQDPTIDPENRFSINGNEVVFCTIGDASTSEGLFWESVNAAGVLKIPMAVFVWDDGYGISVPKKYQTTKESISAILEGFRVDEEGNGIDIYTVKGWDYPALVETFTQGIEKVRQTHIPAVFHVEELTQPQGHSTSGSHERYKSRERLEWEREYDCIRKMREWIIASSLANEDELNAIEQQAKKTVQEAKQRAWKAFTADIKAQIQRVNSLLDALTAESNYAKEIEELKSHLNGLLDPLRKDVMQTVRRALWITAGEQTAAREALLQEKHRLEQDNAERYNSCLYSRSEQSALNVKEIKPVYHDDSPLVNGFEVLNACFDRMLERDARVFAFGEDVGKIGDVNQGFAGLQQKYGEFRVFDTGIREATIVGQGIGMAMRGLRPIAEIQYLDYLIFGLEPMTDDLATLQYRTKGGQKAPVIIRTRGHRLEGIWHTGSPISMLLGSLRGVYLLVPRDMTRAAGFYNTMLLSDEPALIIECLNGYRLKERLPANIGEFTVPLGIPEILREGDDVTLVTYGSCVRIAQQAIDLLAKKGISVELIDVQTLIPFDRYHRIVESLKKTNRIVFLDEDVPGGATSYMMQKVLEEQKGYYYLDSEPVTVTAKEHRTPYGSDGDYFGKPNPEDVFEAVYNLMHEAEPGRFPALF